MATFDKQLQIGLSFTADTTKARQEMDKLKNDLSHIISTAGVGKNMGPQFDAVISQAAQLRGILEEATKTTGRLELSKFERGLKAANIDLTAMAREFQSIDGGAFFNNLAQQVMSADTRVTILSGHLKKFAQGLMNTAMWTIQSNAIHAVQSALQGAYGYAQKLNKGLTDIAIVSDLNTKQLTEFAKTANQMAKELSASTADYVSGALIYYQAGLSDEEVIERTNTTLKLAQTSGESAEAISSYMTAIWNNFYDGSKSVEYYADAISYLGAVTAASNADIAEGMQSFAATAETVGLSFEYGAAALTTLRDITQQSASTIGNSLKTIFARLSSLKMGDTLEDGVDLTKYSKALNAVGVSILDANGELRNMDNILDDLAVHWDDLDKAQKASLAQTVGGVRQYNNLISLMDNYERFQELVVGAQSSDGYLQSQADEYAESWEAAQARLQAAWQSIYQQIINDKFFIELTDFLSGIVNFINNIIEGMGGLKGLFPAIIMGLTSINPNGLANSLHNIADTLLLIKDSLNGVQAEANKTLQSDLLDIYLNQGSSLMNVYNEVEAYDDLERELARVYDLRAQNRDAEAKAAEAMFDRHFQTVLYAEEEAKKLQALREEWDKITTAADISDKTTKRITATAAFATRARNASSGIATNGQYVKNAQEAVINNTYGSGITEKLREALLGKDPEGEIKKICDDLAKESDKAIGDLITKVNSSFHKYKKEKSSVREILGLDETGDANSVQTEIQKLVDEYAALGAAVETENAKGKAANKERVAELTEHRNTIEEIVNRLLLMEDIDEDIKNNLLKIHREAEAAKKASENNTDWTKMAVTATRAATAIFTLSGAMDGVTGAVKEFADGGIDAGTMLSRLVGGLGSAAMAMMTFKNALVELEVAASTVNWILGLIVAGLIAIKAVVALLNKDTNDLKANVEATQELLDKQKELATNTADLSNAVMDLVHAYQELQKNGGDTFDTLNDLKTQAPELVDKYKELATALGVDWSENITKLQLAMEKGIDTGNWEDFIALNEQMQSELVTENVTVAQNNRQNAMNAMASGGKGKVYGNSYSRTNLFGLFDTHVGDMQDIVRENMGEFSTGGSQESFSVPIDQMNKYYESLVKTQKALKDAGYESSTYYKNLSKEITELKPEYEALHQVQKESLDSFKADFDQTAGTGANVELDNLISADMSQYVNSDAHDKLLSVIAQQYSITEDEAQQILRSSEVLGAQERLYQRWLNELSEVGDEQGTQANLDAIAKWYENIPEAYKTFAITLEYDKTKIDDPAYLNELTSEAAEAWRKAKFTQEGENRGFDTAEMQEYADYLASIAGDTDKLTGKNDKLANSLEKDSDAALLVARSVMSMNKGVEALNKNWGTWGDVLKKSSKESKEYYDALKETKNAIADMFEVSTEFVENDFIDKHLKEIGKAAEGDETAIESLRQALADDIIANIVTTNNGNLADGEDPIQLQSIQDKVADLRAWLTDNPIEVGAQMNLDHLETGEDEFLAQCQDIINSAHMTAEQANAFFDAMGFETTFVTEKQPVQKTGYEQVTESYTRGYATYPVYDPLTGEQTGTYQVPQIATKTYPGEPYEYTDYVDAIAMTTDADGNPVAPKIESITRKASAPMNNRSSSNKGGSGSKGGGGGSSKQKTKEPDRYHEINARIQQNQAEISKLTALESRLYGQDKLDAMEREAELLRIQAELYAQKYEEAKKYYEQDKKALENGYGATFNPDGTIANYDEWYGKYLAKYNSGQMDDDAWSKFEDAIKKYEESLNLLDETEAAKLDATNKAFDKGLEAIEYRLKTVNDLIQKDIDYLDYMIKQLDKSMYDTADVVALLGKKMEDIYKQAQNERTSIADILGQHLGGNFTQADLDAFMNGEANIEELITKIGDLTDKEIQELMKHQSELLKYNETLIELREQAYEKLGESIDEFNDKIERQKDIVSDLDGVMAHYRNIIDIVGKDTLGISDEMLRQMSELSVTAAKAALDISRDELTKNQAMLEELYKRREELLAAGREADARLLDKEIEAQEDRVRQLTEAWASAWEDALHAAEESFKNSITLATDAFSKAISGTIGSLDDLQEAYDMQNTLNERYLPTYQKIYELNKLTRDVNNAIDNTDNIAGKERLLKLQQDILKKQQDGEELTEYELGMFQRRLELEQARIAMEEAQNAKSMVRMTRDNEGNWSYTYTADSEAADSAKQNYEDKLYDLKKYNQDSMKEFQDAMLQAVNEYKNQIADLDLTDEERAERLREFQETWVKHNAGMFQQTLDDAQWIIDTYNQGFDDLTNAFNETVFSQVSGYNTLMDFLDTFDASSGGMMAEVGNAYRNWDEQYADIFEKAGTSADGFKDKLADDMKAIEEAMVGEDGDGGAVGAAKELGEQMQDQFDDILSNLQKWFEEGGYSGMIDGIVTDNEKLYGSLQALLTAYAALGKVSNFALENTDIDVGDVDTGTGNGEIPTGLASGGYTGAWGPNGKLAVLHEKELVLNAMDTQNLLTAVGFIRDLTQMISLNAANASTGLGALFSGGVGQGGGYLDQNVTIHAEFPNATNHSEIEEAFNNLIGLASQYAGRKK